MNQESIISFAKEVYKEFPDARKADLLIREFMRRDHEKALEINQNIGCVSNKKQYSWWSWLILTGIFLVSALYIASSYIQELKNGNFAYITMFIVLISFSISSFIGFIKKW